MWSPKRRSESVLRVEVEVVLAARGGVDPVELRRELGEALVRVDDHPAGGHGARRHDRHRALAVRGDEVLRRSPRRAGRSPGRGRRCPPAPCSRRPSGSRVMRRSETTGPPFCERPVWSRPEHVQAVDQRGHAEHLVHGHDAGAADAHHAHAEVGGVHEPARLGQLARRAPAPRASPSRRARRSGTRGSRPRGRRSPCCRRPGGSASCGRTRSPPGITDRQLDFSPQSPQPSHTRSLIQTRSRRLGGLAALALAAQLGGALLVVDQHGHALDLRRAPAAPRAARLRSRTSAIARQLDAAVARGSSVVTMIRSHALELEPAREVRHAQLALDRPGRRSSPRARCRAACR